MEKVTITFDADFSQLEQSINRLKGGGMQELSSATDIASSSMHKLSESAKNIPLDVVSKGMNETTNALKENSQAITENVTKQQSMKAELRDLKNKLQELEDQGKSNTNEFRLMAERAGHLNDQIGDTAARIRVLGDDSKYIKAVSQAISGMAAAYSVAEGASALFGEKNKDVEKALLKVNAAMAIANGVQQIHEVLLKDSNLAVVANSTAQRLYAFTVGESTGALKVFRIALGATGIGLVVLAIGALVTNWKEFVGWLNKSFPSLQAVTNFFTNFRQIAAGTIDAVIAGFKQVGKILGDLFTLNASQLAKDAKDLGKVMTEKFIEGSAEKERELQLKAGLEARKQQIAILEAQGKDANKLKLQLMQDELTLLEKGSEDYNKKLVEIEGVRKDIITKAKEKAKKQLERDNTERLITLEDSYSQETRLLEAKLLKEKEGTIGYLNVQKELIDAELAYKAEQLAQSAQSTTDYLQQLTLLQAEADKKKLDLDKQYYEGSQKLLDDFNAETAKMNEDALIAYNQKKEEQDKSNRQRAKQEAINAAQEIANAEFEIDKQKRDAQLQADIDALESRKDKELSNKNLTESQKQAIQRKYDRLEADVKKKAWEADKKAKEEQAIINGALAITNIWAMQGGTNPVLAGILTAASIVATATQVRVIASQPTPKFAKGKNVDDLYEGQALIGEAGRELRFDRDGSVKLYNRPTFDYVKKDTIIAPNALTEALLGANLPALNLNTLNGMSRNATMTGTFNLDYDKLATTISNQMSKHQKVAINIDEKGFETRIIEGANTRVSLNNRYKM